MYLNLHSFFFFLFHLQQLSLKLFLFILFLFQQDPFPYVFVHKNTKMASYTHQVFCNMTPHSTLFAYFSILKTLRRLIALKRVEYQDFVLKVAIYHFNVDYSKSK